MVFLKSIFSIYIGIFLILPGCLCQLLTPLGVYVLHAPPDGSVDPIHRGPPLAALSRPLDQPPLVDCNCDDTTLKSAERCGTCAIFYQEDILSIVARCPWADLNNHSFSLPNHPHQISSRAPPDFQRPPPLKRPMQTLYGIMHV